MDTSALSHPSDQINLMLSKIKDPQNFAEEVIKRYKELQDEETISQQTKETEEKLTEEARAKAREELLGTPPPISQSSPTTDNTSTTLSPSPQPPTSNLPSSPATDGQSSALVGSPVPPTAENQQPTTEIPVSLDSQGLPKNQ
jgi:hypothetical protein